MLHLVRFEGSESVGFAREFGAVTHRISTLHPYNTRQQTGLAGQQLNKYEIMPGKITPTENNCDYAQAVMECLKAAAVTNAAGGERKRGAKRRAGHSGAGCRAESRRRT